jgi:hypothetical protein
MIFLVNAMWFKSRPSLSAMWPKSKPSQGDHLG